MKVQYTVNAKVALVLIFSYIISSISFCLVPKAYAQTVLSPQVSLFAKAGGGDYYTIYSSGLKKEDSYIGGFQSIQLDPQEENIYFFDPVLRVIARINILDGKIYKVIGKPKSNDIVNYSTTVKFADASLSQFIDFTFDKYGNIYILTLNRPGEPYNNILPSDPRLLKASLKDGTIKEVLKFEDQFASSNQSNYTPAITLTNLSTDHDKYIYAYGKSSLPNLSGGLSSSVTIFRIDSLFSTSELFGASNTFKQLGLNPKYLLNPDESSNFSIKGLTFDHSGTVFVGINDYQNSKWSFFIKQLVPNTNNDGTFIEQSFVGDGSGSSTDIGDGGLAKSAYAGVYASNFLTTDKNGDVYFADNSTNRIRRILNDNKLITTAAGGRTETLIYGQPKSPRAISLQSPIAIFVDKYNNLYIAESNRILSVTNQVLHADKSSNLVKVANLLITKIAGNLIANPKGDATLPDLKLDYTYAGDRTVEVNGENIPDGTTVKLLSVNSDGSTTNTNNSAKLVNGIASIPINIEAGSSKVIKAETDPFIPAPGVYLPGVAPLVIDQIPPEPPISAIKRNEVNLPSIGASGAATNINKIPILARFDFSRYAGWKHTYASDYSNTQIISGTAIDPDNNVTDATSINFGPINDAIYLPNIAPWSWKSKFTVWMRTDSGTANIPIGIGPTCSDASCSAAGQFASNNPTNFAYTNASVTTTWQKFSVISDTNQDNQSKTLIIGGLGQNNNKKIYIWGTRLENSL